MAFTGGLAPSSSSGGRSCRTSTASLIGVVGNLGERLSRVTQRWIPDSWVVCMILTVLALLLAVLGAGAGVEEAVLAWGGGMWALLELAMQFTIALVAAHACVSSRPVFALLDRLASLPNPERPLQAVVLVATLRARDGLSELGSIYHSVRAVRAVRLPTQSEGGHPRPDRQRLSGPRHGLARRVVRVGPSYSGNSRQPSARARDGSPRDRPAASRHRNALHPLQLDLLARHRCRGAPDGRRPAPSEQPPHAQP